MLVVPKKTVARERDCERMPSGERQYTSRDGTMALALLSHIIIELELFPPIFLFVMRNMKRKCFFLCLWWFRWMCKRMRHFGIHIHPHPKLISSEKDEKSSRRIPPTPVLEENHCLSNNLIWTLSLQSTTSPAMNSRQILNFNHRRIHRRVMSLRENWIIIGSGTWYYYEFEHVRELWKLR